MDQETKLLTAVSMCFVTVGAIGYATEDAMLIATAIVGVSFSVAAFVVMLIFDGGSQ